jgi:hypothetical protein
MPIKSILVVLALSGWGLALWALKRPPEERVVTKIEYKDRVVTKERIRIVTAPDGSRVETRVTEIDKAAQGSASSSPARPLPKYSLGLSYELNFTNSNEITRVYNLHLSRRLWESPLWTTVTISSNKSLAIGLSIEF